ncbi:hypothetical protein FB451DRAFT_1561272 [Mycena latifolia]|nr:hypothetical protein FB451DRAFT_1561272 [Mycena latifolia]
MPFNSLNADVLLHVCTLLDVYTIVSLSRIDKYFHGLVSAKQLWISVVRDLSSRYLIDPPAEENLERLSTAELIQQVKRGVSGPLTWSPASSMPPTLCRQIELSLESLWGESSRVDFLPEGRHIVFYKQTGTLSRAVECWDVHRARRVWGWASPDDHVEEAKFDFRRGGSEAVVSLRIYRFGGSHTIILEANLETGESHNLLHLPFAAVWSPSIKASGDFFVCQVAAGGLPFLLLNLSTVEFILFDSANLVNFLLCSRHIVLSYRNPITPDYVRIHNIGLLGHLWRSLNEFIDDDLTDPEGIPYFAVDLPDNDRCFLESPCIALSVCQSPLHHDSYDLVVEVTLDAPRSSLLKRLRNRLSNTTTPVAPGLITTVSRYRLALPPSSSPVLQHTHSFQHQKDFWAFTIRGQYGVTWKILSNPVYFEWFIHQLSARVFLHPRTLPIPRDADGRSSTPQVAHTGAMMFHLGSRTIICYYL